MLILEVEAVVTGFVMTSQGHDQLIQFSVCVAVVEGVVAAWHGLDMRVVDGALVLEEVVFGFVWAVAADRNLDIYLERVPWKPDKIKDSFLEICVY